MPLTEAQEEAIASKAMHAIGGTGIATMSDEEKIDLLSFFFTTSILLMRDIATRDFIQGLLDGALANLNGPATLRFVKPS